MIYDTTRQYYRPKCCHHSAKKARQSHRLTDFVATHVAVNYLVVICNRCEIGCKCLKLLSTVSQQLKMACDKECQAPQRASY